MDSPRVGDPMDMQDGSPIVFLAMFWGGGGPYTIPDILHAYDWINHAVLSRGELETALNTLLAMGMVEHQEGTFKIAGAQFQAFDAFRKKRRKDRFETVDLPWRCARSVSRPPRRRAPPGNGCLSADRRPLCARRHRWRSPI